MLDSVSCIHSIICFPSALLASRLGEEKNHKLLYNLSRTGRIRFLWYQVSPGNEGKWGSVEVTRNTYNWNPLDQIYNYAIQINIVHSYGDNNSRVGSAI
jgi:GH35 family endo-1,4-beta-xylanase